ncbi:transmembrane protein 68-like [Alligator sinensis]|uniref:Transmembrane protein 68-like n=1 Tax=Alligator sinensis TaxID=38654 RepID=A0A1U8DX79_ALLSI|nr:transmembrane protein 68-like [Alligator sinensis]
MDYHGVSLDILIYVVILVTVAAILIYHAIPFILGLCFYFSSIFATIYKRIAQLKSNHSDDTLEGPRKTLSYFWDLFGRIWHGYELHGLENIPEGPALLILYHGAVSIDHIIFVARFFILTHRMCVSAAHRYFFKIPGLQSILEVFSVIPGTKEECLDALKKGQVVAIAPGGAREALFSDDTYKLIWVHHKGFAQLAIDAKVPIIPMYTENVREAYRMPKERKLTRWLYETLGLSVTAPRGGLPVKLRTHIGEPIPYDPNTTAEELAEKTKTALQNLIQSHQQIPGSIWKALLARFDKPQKDD